jgi:hypothetical protein
MSTPSGMRNNQEKASLRALPSKAWQSVPDHASNSVIDCKHEYQELLRILPGRS